MEIPVIVPSHRRAGNVTTHRKVAGVVLCIPEAQFKDYRRHHPLEQLLTHPDSILGISRKRQWILEKFPTVFCVDDDLISVQRIWRPSYQRIPNALAPEEVRDVIDTAADTARQLGAFLFGFNTHSAPMTYQGFRPFGFGGYTMGGAYGILEGSKLRFPDTDLPCEDWFISLLNAFHHRFAWSDRRWAFAFKDTYSGTGGCQEIRMFDGEKRAFDMLRAHFGAAIVRKTINDHATRKPTRGERNPAPRTMHIPWPH